MIIKKIILNTKIVFKFFYRVIKLRVQLLPIDKMSPFRGKLGALGYCQFNLKKDTIMTLINLYRRKLDKDKRIFLKISEEKALQEIFNLITPEIQNYLGKSSFLDGINWMETDAKKSHNKLKQSNSISWHTDNVGNRLKVFLCIEGDGSQPTLIVPDKNRIPSLAKCFFTTFMEAFRRFGIRNKINISNSIEIKHFTGSANIFDTQLLHRGKYEQSYIKRVLLSLEFSNSIKHKISRGPIGTKEGFNSFVFDKSLLKIDSFNSILDPDRIIKTDKYFIYSNINNN